MGAARSAGGLRGELTEFVGRRAELAQVRDALARARLVTLTGPGGIGKTRLALQVAAGAGRAFRDGVWLAELTGLRDPGLLVAEVARSLGLSDKSARWAVASLADYLQARQLLLVLDGCEHLADACAVMADVLLRGCPELRIIATSRHVLGVAGEVTVAVPPMTVPAEDSPNGPEELLGYEAVRLFAGRGAAVLPGFALDEDNGAAVARVCRELDGIPLAVELAAVRLRSLSPGQILDRLDGRFQLLSGGGPAGQPHHRTLQAALAWSYELLADGEQAMWRRVSVFAGSFDLDAAEAVCGGPARRRADRRPDRRAGGQVDPAPRGSGHGPVPAAGYHPRVRAGQAARPGQRARAPAAAPGVLRGASRSKGGLRSRPGRMDRRARYRSREPAGRLALLPVRSGGGGRGRADRL